MHLLTLKPTFQLPANSQAAVHSWFGAGELQQGGCSEHAALQYLPKQDSVLLLLNAFHLHLCESVGTQMNLLNKQRDIAGQMS